MRYRVLPYRSGSRSASALAAALPGGRVLRLQGSTFIPRRDDVIINWGNVNCQNGTIGPAVILNHGGLIRDVSNKLRFFNLMRDAGLASIVPEFWLNRGDIPNDVYPVVCRTVLAGHSGEGIVIANNTNELVPAPLYTRYIPKQEEYRIHVGVKPSGEHYDGTPDHEASIISVQRKARREDHENPNWQVRNHANGFIYARNNVTPPACVLEVAKQALEATGLDFGGCDVIYNDRRDRAYCLEVNTAPGVEGTTVQDYRNFFLSLTRD